jgi:glycosyltransferase involved in cell wall biosynthesis
MIIAVNTRMLSGDAAAGKFLFEVFSAIAEKNKTHQFVFITENEAVIIPLLSNVKMLLIKQPSYNPLLWKLWYNYKLPSALRKIKADILVSVDSICSLRTKVPQCMLVSDLAFVHHPDWFDKKYVRFMKSNFMASLQKTGTVITFSEHTKNELISKYKIGEDKINKIYPGPGKDHQPIDWEAREAVKEKYADGKEYFLFEGVIHNRSNLINLLKAFSLFKKRQKSSMQLIIATDAVPEKDAFIESLRLYKYRNELKILPALTEPALQQLTAAAYCAVNLSSSTTDINFLLSAMKSDVPVIANNSLVAKEILGEAALYADASSPAAIAEQMMLLFKDENKRNELVKKGTEQSANYSLDKMTRELWQKIVATAGER